MTHLVARVAARYLSQSNEDVQDILRELQFVLVGDDLTWHLLPNAYQAKVNLGRLEVRLEDASEEVLREVKQLATEMREISTKMKRKIGLRGNQNFIFDVDLDWDSDIGRQNRKKIQNLRKQAWSKVVALASAVGDPRVVTLIS